MSFLIPNLFSAEDYRRYGKDDDDDHDDSDDDGKGYQHTKAVNKFNLKGGHVKQSKTESLSYGDAGFKPAVHVPQFSGGYEKIRALSKSHYKAGGNSESLTEQYLRGLGVNSKMPYIEPSPSGKKAYSNLAERLKSNVRGSSSVDSHMGVGLGHGEVGTGLETGYGNKSFNKQIKTLSKSKFASRSSFRAHHQSTTKGLHTGVVNQLGGGMKTYHFKKTWRSRMRANYRSNFRSIYKTKHIVY